LIIELFLFIVLRLEVSDYFMFGKNKLAFDTSEIAPSMCFHMFFKITFLCESSMAFIYRALKWPLINMGSQMIKKISPFFNNNITFFIFTKKSRLPSFSQRFVNSYMSESFNL